jgi:hypothetical protein
LKTMMSWACVTPKYRSLLEGKDVRVKQFMV